MMNKTSYAVGAWFGALVLCFSGCSSSGKDPSAAKTIAKNRRITTTLLAAVGVTAEQLNAHLGIGVPTGWEPVDQGEARVWVPSDWILETQGSCIGGASAGMISTGKLPQANCTPASQWPIPTQAVGLVPSSQTSSGRQSFTVDGYGVYQRTTPASRWNYYDVPQLGVQIATRGTLGRRILDTLAPSARTVALDPALETAPASWHAITEDSVALSIPPSWTVDTPTFSCGSPFLADSAFLLIKPHIEFAPCAFPPPTPVAALKDGASVFLPPNNPNAPSPTGQPVTTLQHGATTISVYAEVGDPDALDLFVHRTGSSITHVLTVGLGRDGRIAGGVIALIQAHT
ncbi:MAG: hypothetical protein ACLPVY_19750 [Acidimicrobiia bacterium]